ncbi:MAG: inositol monophosphatase family protein, partial [Halobacteria archaeon]|nr:inositol monophosphatase family protein [Halobacteria archaeon]
MEEFVQTAIDASKLGAEIHKKGFRKARQVEYKAPRSLVTEIDLEAERAIKEHISSEYPKHGILAEETGEKNTESAYRWLIDPLDGTTNFVHGVPNFAVSIALEVDGETQVGVVHNTPMEKTYSAV